MYRITFYGHFDKLTLDVMTKQAVKVIVESKANIMVEWGNGEWGDAVAGECVTESFHKLIYGQEAL